MDVKIKASLIEALRSGKYQQAQRALRFGDGFCCLGVLCDVMGAKRDSGDGDLNATIDGEKQEYYLSPIALEVAGLSDQQQEVLYQMNDEGATFAEIADHVEANL